MFCILSAVAGPLESFLSSRLLKFLLIVFSLGSSFFINDSLLCLYSCKKVSFYLGTFSLVMPVLLPFLVLSRFTLVYAVYINLELIRCSPISSSSGCRSFIFIPYFLRECFLEIKNILPNLVRRFRTTRSSTLSHPF